jgi:hypothetical protein
MKHLSNCEVHSFTLQAKSVNACWLVFGCTLALCNSLSYQPPRPKEMDRGCMVQVCLSFGLETEMIRIFLALFKEKGLSDTHYTPSSLQPSRAVEPFTVQLAP